jgi:hypothetical protein
MNYQERSGRIVIMIGRDVRIMMIYVDLYVESVRYIITLAFIHNNID